MPKSEVERLERELWMALLTYQTNPESTVGILDALKAACIAQGRAEALVDAPAGWRGLTLVWVPGANVTAEGQYVVPSQDVWHFDGDTWYSYKDGDTEQERDDPEWAIPWSALPHVPEGT